MSSSSFGVAPDARSDRPAIRVDNVSKHYVMFERPEDRFKQMVVPRLQRVIGQPPKRYYRDFAALNGVSLEVGRGETVGIIGRNGSGKSTLLQIICGTLRPTSGTVEVNGRIAALLELGAGFNPEFTGRENVFLNGQILGVPRQEMEWRFDDIARFADIGSFIDQPVKTYSSGMYVRLAFATAINVDPDILVVDEALAVGDEAFQRKCFARIEDIKDKGGTILFVSHGAQTIVQLCTRAVLFDSGEKILEGAPKRVVAQYQRLINASEETFSDIRQQIQSLRNRPDVVGNQTSASTLEPTEDPVTEEPVADLLVSEASQPPPSNASDRVDPIPVGANLDGIPTRQSDELDVAVEYFDTSLKSQTVIVLEERGAKISNLRVLTLASHPVNVLQMGKRYRVCFDVEFFEQCEGVGFEFLIKNVSGLVLGGTDTHASKESRIDKCQAGSLFNISFEFSCQMLPGVYLVSAGVRGRKAGEVIQIHKIVEGIMIRVAAEPDLCAIGYASLNVLPHVSLAAG